MKETSKSAIRCQEVSMRFKVLSLVLFSGSFFFSAHCFAFGSSPGSASLTGSYRVVSSECAVAEPEQNDELVSLSPGTVLSVQAGEASVVLQFPGNTISYPVGHNTNSHPGDVDMNYLITEDGSYGSVGDGNGFRYSYDYDDLNENEDSETYTDLEKLANGHLQISANRQDQMGNTYCDLAPL
jgi:hypothetical protein